MSISGKELAKKLGISESSVSVALNNRPGVSNELRKKVLQAAQKYGYDFSKVTLETETPSAISKNILLIRYIGQSVLSTEIAYFSRIIQGIDSACKNYNCLVNIFYLYEGPDFYQQLETIKAVNCCGIIVMATELQRTEYRAFLNFPVPVVFLDTYMEDIKHDCILINHVQGAYNAVRYLIGKYKVIPEYIHSSYEVNSFLERKEGYMKALRESGASSSDAVIHEALPTVDGVRSVMHKLLSDGQKPARCYFADNDMMAISIVQTLQEYGYEIPKDVAVCGFDNDVPDYLAGFASSLTTVTGPSNQMWGEIGVEQLIRRINNPNLPITKTELATELIIRESA